MRKIKPLNAVILAAAKQCQSSPQFVFKTRIWVAISTGTGNPALRRHLSTQNEGLLTEAAANCLKPAPPLGARIGHPEIEIPQQSPSHTWASTEATPTTGSR